MMGDVTQIARIGAYVALFLSIVSLWMSPRYWIPLLVAALGLGYAGGVLMGPAGVWILLLAAVCVTYNRAKLMRGATRIAVLCIAVLALVVIALLMGLHRLPGFDNMLVAQGVTLSAGAAPYSLYLSFDKAAVGLLILGFIYRPLIANGREWRESLRMAAPIMLSTIAALVLVSIAIGYLRFDPKWNSLFWIWAASNLLLTCVSEEAFFRAFIQGELSRLWSKQKNLAFLAVGISALLFGLAHFAGGLSYVALSTLAGLGYGFAYHRSKRVEMAILTHFTLNAIHFLLFTYPRSL